MLRQVSNLHSAAGKPASVLDKIKGTTRSKDLLLDVKGSVSSGHVLAILGPSGAGKTTRERSRLDPGARVMPVPV